MEFARKLAALALCMILQVPAADLVKEFCWAMHIHRLQQATVYTDSHAIPDTMQHSVRTGHGLAAFAPTRLQNLHNAQPLCLKARTAGSAHDCPAIPPPGSIAFSFIRWCMQDVACRMLHAGEI